MSSASSTTAIPDVRRDKENGRCLLVVTDHPGAFTENEAKVLMMHYDTLGASLLDEGMADTDDGAVRLIYAHNSERNREFVLFRVFVRADISIRSAIRRFRSIGQNAVAFLRNPRGFRVVSSACSRARQHKSEHHGCPYVLRHKAHVGAFSPAY